jgi:hypothetical protein
MSIRWNGSVRYNSVQSINHNQSQSINSVPVNGALVLLRVKSMRPTQTCGCNSNEISEQNTHKKRKEQQKNMNK